MKKLLLFAVIALSTSAFASTEPVPDNVRKSFHAQHPAAAGVTWHEYDTYYVVNFQSNGINCQLRYDLSGSVISLRRAYYEKDLSPFLVEKVRQSYPNKKIFGITEFTTGTGITYEIILEDHKSWVHVRSDANGEMVQFKKLRKARS